MNIENDMEILNEIEKDCLSCEHDSSLISINLVFIRLKNECDSHESYLSFSGWEASVSMGFISLFSVERYHGPQL